MTIGTCVLQKETPLANAVFWAARKGNLALLQLLLNSGRVDVDCKDCVWLVHDETVCLCMLVYVGYMCSTFVNAKIRIALFLFLQFANEMIDDCLYRCSNLKDE